MSGSDLQRLADVSGAELVGSGATKILDVTHDSRQVRPGSLFVAVRGSSSDGHDFISQAVAIGAAAVCVDHSVSSPIPQLVVGDTRGVMALLAAEVHGHPSRDIAVVGVTGTNGKTTVTHYVESIVNRSGGSAGLIGTIQTRAAGKLFESERTTPEATDFQRLLASMRQLGVGVVATEVSSHALELGRVRETRFEVAAFTNLSQDHLDFHGDMESYLSAKKSLFIDYELGTAVINIDDPAGREIAVNATSPVVSVGVEGDAWARAVGLTTTGTRFELVTPWGSARVEASIFGEFNVENAVMASVCCLAADMPFDDVVESLSALPGVPGRFQMISGDDPVTVIVDYAHTPEGVRLAVETARGLGSRKVIALVGAGGDRDREKRPMMGAAVSKADVAVVTSDNPRSENPDEIVRAVASGVARDVETIIEVDRRAAIRAALEIAGDGDTVLLLGRGHEPFQEVDGRLIPFDDREVGRAELALLRRSAKNRPEVGSMEQ